MGFLALDFIPNQQSEYYYLFFTNEETEAERLCDLAEATLWIRGRTLPKPKSFPA
jgi:hypothetical protein